VSDTILLTDATDAAVADAAAQLDAWRVEVVRPEELPDAIESTRGVRAVLVSAADPDLMRLSVERAHRCGCPVIVACADDAARRRLPTMVPRRKDDPLLQLGISGRDREGREKRGFKPTIAKPIAGESRSVAESESITGARKRRAGHHSRGLSR
jgi:hypothetical protein